MARGKKASLGFILAPSYHGASALSWKLNKHPDILSLGRGNPSLGEDQICSCGEPVSICPFWGRTMIAVGSSEESSSETFLPQSPQILENPKFNVLLNGVLSLVANEFSQKTWRVFYEQAEQFLQKQEIFLSALQSETPHKIFIDAECSNIKFMTMLSMGFPVKGAVHITRDPRGYAAAWKKHYPDATAEKIAVEWASSYTRIKRLKSFFSKVPFLTIRYEDFIARPDETLQKVAAHMGLPEIYVGDIGNTDSLKNHLLGLEAGDMSLADGKGLENWRETLHPEDQSRVLVAAGPLFSEFGYKP